jgi:hypothetical protein
MIRGGLAFKAMLFFREFGLLFFLALDIALGWHFSAGFAFSSVLYTIRETQEMESGSAIIAYKVEIAQIVRKGIRKLHCPNINFLTAI